MKVYVGNTDSDWVAFLRDRPSVTEANFWTPSGDRTFRAIKPGEPFLFKTKKPHYQLVGGGYFDDFFTLRASEAWQVWGPSNGVATESELFARLQKYRERNGMRYEVDPTIGCIIIGGLFFADRGAELQQPPRWPTNVVSGKAYELSGDDPDAEYVSHALMLLGHSPRVDIAWEPQAIRFDLALTKRRRGQGSFRVAVENAYDRRCAVTGNKVLPTLEAAHIKPYAAGGEHDVPNGLLLKSDVHRLFDLGYLSVDPDYRFRVSPLLREKFGNGDEFYQREGTVIRMPERDSDRPDPAALDYHFTTIFKSA